MWGNRSQEPHRVCQTWGEGRTTACFTLGKACMPPAGEALWVFKAPLGTPKQFCDRFCQFSLLAPTLAATCGPRETAAAAVPGGHLVCHPERPAEHSPQARTPLPAHQQSRRNPCPACEVLRREQMKEQEPERKTISTATWL